LSLFPSAVASGGTILLLNVAAITGTVLHLVSHAVSKGLFFLSAGAVMHQTETRDIRDMGGLAGKMPFTAVSSTLAALSIAGTPPFACFISEFLIFVGAFEVINVDGFFLIPTALMLVATVFSLAYSLRFISKVFLGQPKAREKGAKKLLDVPNYMKLAMGILVVFVVILGIYPTFFVDLIHTVSFG
jgi:NADH:ubiquinone oxidoreductase subunit 5 (subunit L)/multisubunit Na+/H+ antiporter MnhA subunit